MNIPTTSNYLLIRQKANEQNMQFKNVLFRKVSFLVLWVSTLCMPILGQAQVSGTVFRDFNANGTKDNSASFNEIGIGGITVNAYNSTGTLLATQTSSTITATLGQYSFPASGANSIPSGTPVRLEFTGFPTGDYPAAKANSLVQFVTSPLTNVNMGVNNPEDYVGHTNPYVAAPQYVNGTYNNSGSAAFTGLYTFQYDADSNATGGLNALYQDQQPNTKATVGTMGATWGLAYQRSTKTLYTSAVLRRFCGFGPLGTGGIYKADMTNPATTTGASNFIDVKTIGIPTGNDVRTASGCNAISTDPMAPANDIASADNIGKVGIGGIEYDENRNILWLVNLNDRKLYGIKNISPSSTPTSADVIGGISINLPSGYSVVNGVLRPWGVKVHRGYIYVGAVADASGEMNLGDLTNLKGYILKLDLNNMAAGFTVEYEFSFDYNRGNYGPTSGLEKWTCWQVDGYNAQSSWYTQPIISDMEFDADGSIIVGVLDRGGLQNGNENYGHVACTNTLTTISARGDVLRLCKTAGGYVMSGNSGCTTTIPPANLIDSDGDPAAPNNYIQEYYWGEHGPVNDNTGFNETALGALAILPGSSQVMATVMDPENFHSGGVLSLNNVTGAKDNAYNLYYSNNAWGVTGATMAKAIGLGDIEILANTPTIEIGNRVWNDTNKNGIQDAGEAGVAGVTIQLSKYNGTSYVNLATCTTDANGNYYFSSAIGTSATGITYNLTELTPNSQFKLSIPTTYNGLMLTAPNIVSGSNTDEIDSDADGFGTISFTTGNVGENNHSYDIGFQTPIEICTGEEYTLSVPSGTTGQWYKDGLPIAGATGISYVVTTAGNYNFIGTNVSGCTFSSCTNAAFIQGNCARLGNYVWNDTNADGLNNEVASAGINNVKVRLYKDNGSGTYVLTDSVLTANKGSNPGYYQFVLHTFGNYKVQFVAPTGKNLTKTTQTANTDNNSDADGIGWSGVINMIAGANDSTIDAGFVNSCAVGNILYLCGNVKPADADAFDHGMIEYLQGLGNTITPALTQNVAGLGLYNPMTMLPTGITNLNAFDAVIISPTVEGSYSPTLIDSLRKTRLPVLASDYWANADLGLSNNAGFNYQNDVYNGTSQVPFYNYVTLNPTQSYNCGVFWGDYESNATTYLWLDGTAKTNGNQGVYYAYEPTDAINNPVTGLPLNNHGRRVFYGIHANGIYENPTNGGAVPSPASAWLNPYTHLTSYGKRYLDSALALICTTKAPAGSIGNFVWNDTDGDGTQDVGETGINGVKVKLYQDNGSGVYNLIDSTTTAANGAYSFTGLGSWNYYVNFPTTSSSLSLSPQTTTAATDGNSDANTSTGNSPIFAIDANGTGTAKDNLTIDAGYRCIQLFNAALNGQTIATCDCKLYDSGGPSANYSGTQNYTVTLQAPVGQNVKFTLNSLSSEMGFDYLRVYDGNSTSTFTLKYFTGSVTSPVSVISSGQYLTLQWFADGGVNMAGFDASISCVTAASIGDYVWKDVNNDGLQNEPSAGINSVQVFLYKDNGSGTFVKMDSVWTDYLNGSSNPGGYYIFNVEQSGTYKVKFPMPGSGAGGAWATANVGGNDGVDSDADPLTGFSPAVVLDVNGTGLLKSNMTIDAAYISNCPNTISNGTVTVNSASNGTTVTNLEGGIIWGSSNSSTGVYGNNENYSVTIQSPMATGRVNVHPYFYNIAAGDQLIFYDGPNTASPVLATVTGASISPQTMTVVSTGRTMTIRIISDATTSGTFYMEFSTGDMLINTCWGWNVLLRSDMIEAGKAYTLSDVGTGSANAPICVAYFDANKNLVKTEVGTCINLHLGVANPRTGRQYGQVSFERDTLAPSDIPPLTLARIAWILKNAPSLGFNYNTSSTAAANVQSAVRILMGQQTGGSSLAIQAIAAVPTIPTQPIISIAGCDTVSAGGSISYAITTNSNTLNLSVSDGGALPTLCGTNPVGTTLVGNVLTVGGTGTRTVNVCLTRNSAIELKLLASDETSLISTKVEIYYPCDPFIQRFLAVTSQTSPYGEACGKWTPVGSVGNYVWNDTDGDGTQDAGETGINGVTVELYKETSAGSGSYALAQTTTTANNGTNDGAYNFIISESANYYVKFPTTSGANVLTFQTITAATDGNSDANAITGNSPIFAINMNGVGAAKDNNTIDAGFVPLSACILDGITQDFSMAVNSIFINPTLANVYGYKESSAAIGREVDIFIQRNTTAASDTIWGVTSATTNEMGLQSSATAKGKVIFTYDGVDGNANALDATGLGHLNMSGNSNGFSFNYTATGTALSPSTVTAKVRVYTDASNWSTQSITLTQGLNMTTYIPVSFSRAGFTVGAGTGVNWSNVGAVEIEIETATNGAEVSIKDVKMPCYITGTVGNYVWIDTNGDGLQNEPTSNGVNGVTVELWTAGNNGIGGLGAGTDMLMATTTTANDGSGNPGYYNFNITNSGNHFIKFPATVNGKVATTQIATAGTDGNNDISGAGVTPMFVMDLGGTGVALNNPTLDAGYKTFSQSTLACDFLLDSLSTEFSYTGKTNTNYTHIASGLSIPFGGERDILISDISRPSLPTTMDYSIYTGTNILDFASAAGMFEKMTIQWDGIDNNATSLNYTGLGGLDFQSLNMDKFTFELMADFPPTTDSLPITLQLWSNAGAVSQTTQKIKFPNDGNFRTVTFNLNTMTAIAGSGVDLSNIGAIQIQYDMTLRNGWDITMQDYRLECTPLGSIGNYVWSDTDADGTQDVGETGINGVTVELYKETTPSSGSYALAQTTTTATNGASAGYYNFVITESANYYVHFPTTTSGKTLSSATTTAAIDGNSDANVSTGNSPVFAMNVSGTGTAKDNSTIDAGYKLMPIITAVAGSCDPSANQYNVTGTVTGTFPTTGQILVNIAGEGSVLYTAPFASSPISYNITGLISDGASKTVTITFTDAPNLNTSVNYTAPTACITNSCVSGGAGSETHTYTLPLSTTDIVNQAVTLPKFDDMGGTRILEKVLVTQKQSTVSAALLENTSAGTDSFFLQLNTKGLLSMAGDTLLFSDYSADYNNELTANVFVPTNGAYPSWLGDINIPIGAGFIPSTLARMEISSTVVTNDLPNFIDPRLNSGWVTNITGDATHDDDIWYISPLEISRSSSKLLTTSLSNYIGTGNLAMIANADAGHSLQGGGGNMVFDLRTKYKTEVTVTYYYCPAAKVGNYVWTDTDADGTQDGSETGINGVTVELYKETAPSSGSYALAQTTTTANDGSNDGAYNFVITESANYYVHFPLVSGVDILTTQTTTAATDGNSDANISTGNSPIFAMDVNGTGIAQNNQTIDAGYTPVSSTVGDYVWLDIDKDGQQDANEKGVSGVTVSLINNLNEVVATTQTDAYGYYLFHNVAVGDYTVRFSLPIAYAFTIQEPSPSATGSDANGAGYSNTFHVNAGDNITDIDAGIYYEKVFRSGLGNFVWLDANANGRQDVGELGVSNVAVMLYNTSGTLLQATLTNNAGYYQFLDLTAGNYVVGVRLPLGYQFVNPNVGGNDNVDSDILPSTGKTATIVLPINTFDQSNDAGIVAIVNTQASIGDYVWNDANHNGLQESDEVGVSNVTVELWDDQNSLVQTTRTDAYGYYMFTDITAGFYSVKFELPAGWVFSTADAGTDNDIDSDVITPIGGTDTIRVAEGDRITNVDAGVYNPAATTKGVIGDYVWYDLDKDGIQDATEAGVPGVMVTLYDGSNFVIAQTTTDQNGKYLFIDLPVGTYSVGFSNIREGYTFTTPTQGGDGTLDSDVIPATGKTATVTLTSNAIILDLDAGIYPTTRGGGYASLGDRVWYDVNNNGLQNTGEVGAANIIVRLYDATSTQVGLVLTDGSGRYLFSGLNPGTYTVNFTLPSGYTFSPQKQGTNDNTDSDVNILGTTAPITLMAGENNMRIDAGLYKSTGTASIGDFVWNDANNDGVQNVGEKGVSGVSVTLYNALGTAIAGTVTDKNGYYLFPYMSAGSYSVGFNNFPAGFALVPAGQGGDASTDSDPNVLTGKTAVFTLTAGQAKTDIDAGLYAARASLGDYVWNDVNANGLQDVTEEGVSGITVHLYNASNQYISSAVTDANGYYLFYNLTAGNYYVNVSDLPTYTVFTVSNAGDDAIDSDINPVTALSQTVALAANDFNKTVDAGLNMDANASLEGYVWFDANGDGLQDVTEVPVTGVLVTLESLTGVALSRTISGADGMYHFENVVEGSYKVRFSNIPTGSRFTSSDANGGNNDRLDSDANPTTGLSTGSYAVISGQRLHAADAGLLPPGSIAGTAFEDVGTPPNGLQDQTEITFSNILVMLYTADSTLVGTTSTDKKGNYLFTGLYPDNYFVVFDAINGRSFTAKNIDNNVSDDIDSDVNFFGGTDVFALGVGENIINVDAGYLPAGFIFPVTMAYFTAELVNTDGLLKWKTTAEVNTKHFEIYRSLDEFSYEKIGNNVTATGTPTTSTSYNTFDYNVNKLNVDRVFYRLKIIDVDGSFNWSNVVALNLTHTDQTIFAQVYPNPAETTIWVDYQLFDGATADLKITNSVGQAVYTETIKAKDSLQQLSIDISRWADGVYYLNIQSENGNFVRKIIKE